MTQSDESKPTAPRHNPVFALLHRWGSMRYPWPLWLIPVVLISPAAFLIPVDVFVQYPWVEVYAGALAKVIPMIDRAAHLYPHPQQFKAFFAYAWTWLPLCLVLAWFDGHGKRGEMIKKAASNPMFFFSFLLLAYGASLLWYVPANPLFSGALISEHDERAVMYRSVLSWGLIGPFETYFAAGFAIGVLRYARALWAIRAHYDIGPQ